MDIPHIKDLIVGCDKIKQLESEDFFLSSFMAVVPNLSLATDSVMVNFYNKKKNQIASFSLNGDELKLTGISPPMKEVEIAPLGIEKPLMSVEEAMKKCTSRAKDDEISRVVCVLRISSNSRNESGPCWHINIFLKNLHILSVVFDAENGEEIASSTKKLTV